MAGRDALIVDDFTISAGTLAEVAQCLVDRGARAVYAAVTHGVFAGKAMQRLEESPIERLLVTDTVENQPVPLSDRVQVVSVAPLLGEAIRRIASRESLSVLFTRALTVHVGRPAPWRGQRSRAAATAASASTRPAPTSEAVLRTPSASTSTGRRSSGGSRWWRPRRRSGPGWPTTSAPPHPPRAASPSRCR